MLSMMHTVGQRTNFLKTPASLSETIEGDQVENGVRYSEEMRGSYTERMPKLPDICMIGKARKK